MSRRPATARDDHTEVELDQMDDGADNDDEERIGSGGDVDDDSEEDEMDPDEETLHEKYASNSLIARVETHGFSRGLWWMPRLEFSGILLTAFAFGILVFTSTFYNFTPAVFFTDFSTVWLLPLLLQFVPPFILAWTHRNNARWPMVILLYTVLCLLIVIVEFASALYAIVNIYNATYSGSNNWFAIGGWVAAFILFVLLLLEIYHLYCIIALIPIGACRGASALYRSTTTSKVTTGMRRR